MEIDTNKLAQMREESKDTLNILEDALSTNANDETTIDVETEETATAGVPTPRAAMSLSPIKEKIGKLHIAFLKEIHEQGKQSNVSNDSMAAIVKKYRVNLFDALSCIDQVAQDKYQFSILKESLFEPSTQQIRIEFNSDNVEKFLSLENADNWRTELGCNRPDNSDFQQQIIAFLREKGFKVAPPKTKMRSEPPIEDNDSEIEIVLHPETEQDCGVKIESCSAEQEGTKVIVIAKATAKNSIPGYRNVQIIAYDKNDKIIGRGYENWLKFGRIQSIIERFEVRGKTKKVEIFPALN